MFLSFNYFFVLTILIIRNSQSKWVYPLPADKQGHKASDKQVFRKQSRVKFSDLKKGGQKNVRFNAFLQNLNQNPDFKEDPKGIMKFYLLSSKGRNLCNELLHEGILEKKLRSLISDIKSLHENEIDDFKKRQWVSLVSKNFSFKELRQFGFNISKRGFAAANKHLQEVGPGCAVPETRGRPKISEKDKEVIVKFFCSKGISYNAANRTCQIKVADQICVKPVRYLNYPVETVYTKFKKENPHMKVSLTKFRKLKPKWIKKARKRSDLCEICQKGKYIGKKLKGSFHSACVDCDLVTCDISSQLTDQNRQFYESQTQRLKLYKDHQELVQHQRKSYKQQISDLLVDEAIIVMDFKENIKLQQSNEQIGKDFFNQPQRTLFGVALIYKDASGDIKKHFYDIFSKCLNHNSFFVMKALENVFNTNSFKEHKFKRIIFWMDNGPGHFKTNEMVYNFREIQDKLKVQVCWNYFTEYHGKNVCDSRFSIISRFLEDYSSTENGKLFTTLDVVKALQQKFSAAEQNILSRKSGAAPKNKGEQIILEINEMPANRVDYKIKNLRCFKSFYINDAKEVVSQLRTGCGQKIFVNKVNIQTYKYPEGRKLKSGFADKEFNESSSSVWDILLKKSKKASEMLARGQKRKKPSNTDNKSQKRRKCLKESVCDVQLNSTVSPVVDFSKKRKSISVLKSARPQKRQKLSEHFGKEMSNAAGKDGQGIQSNPHLLISKRTVANNNAVSCIFNDYSAKISQIEFLLQKLQLNESRPEILNQKKRELLQRSRRLRLNGLGGKILF